MLDLQTGDTIKVELREGARPRGQTASKTLPQAKVQKIQPCNGNGQDLQMISTDPGIRIVTQKGTLLSMPDYLVMRLDLDGQWRLATEPRQ